jgi:hypothetical protein
MVVRILAVSALFMGLAFAGVLHAQANTVGCGGNSYSYAEVRQPAPGRLRHGPIVAMPDSLCADLIERSRRPPPSLDIVIDPRSEAPSPDARPQDPAWK